MKGQGDPGEGQQGHWDRTYSENPAFFGEGPSRFAEAAVETFRKEGVRTVLELGCGHGRDTLLFARNGFQVTALDYSGTALEALESTATYAGGGSPIVTKVFDVRKPLPFSDGSFDACYSHMLLCMELSTVELRFLLGEIRRILRPAGLALYSVRNTFDQHYRPGLHRSEDIYEVPGGFVVHFFSEEKVRDLSKGFELLEIRRMQEGGLPRELFAVFLRKQEAPGDGRPEKDGLARQGGGGENGMPDMMGKYEEFFHSVYHTGVLDAKSKHLVALAASLAGGCDS